MLAFFFSGFGLLLRHAAVTTTRSVPSWRQFAQPSLVLAIVVALLS